MNAARFAFTVIVLLASSAAAHAGEQQSCKAEVGAEEAQVLVDRCTDISPATHPPCNVQNPCSLIVSEIQRSCDLARTQEGEARPDYCSDYPASGY